MFSKNKNLQKILIFLSILVLIIVFFWSKYVLIFDHFSHYDDSYIAYAYIIIDNYSPIFFKNKLIEYGGLFGEILANNLYYYFIKFSFLFEIFKKLLAPFAIAETSTYAPLQFFFTNLTINLDKSYSQTLFSSRLPSAVFSFFSLIIFFAITKFIEKKSLNNMLLIGLTILIFSWMSLIYSVQSPPYSAGIFSIFCLFLIFINKFNKNISIIKSFFWGIILSLLSLTNYQTMFFLPGFYFALFYSYNFSLKNFLSNWFICGLINLITTFLIYIFFLTNKNVGTHSLLWMAGPNFEYVFNAQNSCGNKNLIICAFNFFINNFFIVIQSIVSFSDLSGTISKIYTLIIILLSFLGLFFLIKNKNKILKGLFFFIFTSIIVWIILILNQLLSFSPTRHSLVLIVIFSLTAPFGFNLIINLIQNNKIKIFFNYLPIIFSITFLIFYTINFSAEKNKRLDPFQSVSLTDIISKYKVSKIITYGWTLNPVFETKIINQFNHKMGSSGSIIVFDKKFNTKNKNIMFISHRSNQNLNQKMNKFSEFKELNYPHKIIYEYTKESETEVGFGNLTKNGSNNLFIKIIKPNQI